MKDDFFTYQAQTTPHPLAMEVSHAKGSYIYDTDGKAHLDFVAGVSAMVQQYMRFTSLRPDLQRFVDTMVTC